MDYEFTKRELKALNNLRFECDYEEDNYITLGKFAVGIGSVTLESLQDQELIKKGTCKWHGKDGYRITELGRTALAEYKPKPKSTKRETRLKPLEPRLRSAPSRLGE